MQVMQKDPMEKYYGKMILTTIQKLQGEISGSGEGSYLSPLEMAEDVSFLLDHLLCWKEGKGGPMTEWDKALKKLIEETIALVGRDKVWGKGVMEALNN